MFLAEETHIPLASTSRIASLIKSHQGFLVKGLSLCGRSICWSYWLLQLLSIQHPCLFLRLVFLLV